MTLQLPNLRHLLAFAETCRLGSVSAAARAIHLSQPAVTQAISSLEQSVGLALFERTGLGMRPTPGGGIYRARVERLLEQIRAGLGEPRRPGSSGDSDRIRSITSPQLLALVAVVEHGGFAAAARSSAVARATLHRATRDLERALDVALFERTSFGVEPTRDAVELARRLRVAFAELEQARAELSAAAGGDRGRTVIGAMPLARTALVPITVLEFAAAHPTHTVTLLDGPYEGMLDALRHGAADLLVGALREPAPREDIVQEHLFDDPLALVVRSTHPLARKRRPSVRELSRYPWIAPRRGSPLRRQFDELLESFDHEARTAPIECNSLVAARAMLLASDRIMLLSAAQIAHELAAGELVALTHPLGRVVRHIGLTTRRNWQPTAAQTALLALLRRRTAGGRTDSSPNDGPLRQEGPRRTLDNR